MRAPSVGIFDVIVVGAGIVGLAHAYVAAQKGLRVAVVERDWRCVGASIRNFGFITVTGQRAGDTWRRARRSRDVWAQVCKSAQIPMLHHGLWLLAQRPAAREVLEAFLTTPMGQECVLFDAEEAQAQMPVLQARHASAALYSPHELRVESRHAIPQLANWLAEVKGVRFFWGESVLEVDPPVVRTSQRCLSADRVVVCPGADLNGVAGQWLAPHRLPLTRLQMLRVQPQAGFHLPAAVMGDLSLVRYAGYTGLPESQVLRAQLEQEEAESLAHGIHLIVVQSADGSLVVGDSHHDDDTPEPFASDTVDALILRHLQQTLRLTQATVTERWTGVYPTGHTEDCLTVAPAHDLRVVVVTSGTGASTAFGIAEEVFEAW